MWFTVGGFLCWGVLHFLLFVVAVFTTERYFLYYRERFNVDLPVLPEREAVVPWWRPIKALRLQRQYVHLLFRRQSDRETERERQRAIRPLKLDALWLSVGWIIGVLGAAIDKHLS